MDIVLVVVFLGILYFLAHAFAELFRRTKIPDILWLIMVGVVLGPVLGVVTEEHFGAVGPVLVTVTLIVILFQSGLGMRFETLRKASSRGLVLTLANFIATMVAVAVAAMMLTDLSPLSGLLLGAIVGGTSSAEVIPLVAQLEMQSESKAVLVLESVLTDALCIVTALALLDILQGNAPNLGLKIGEIISSFLVAAVLGFFLALIWAAVLKRIRTIRDSFFATTAFVLLVYGLAELLGVKGTIAALAFGIALGNIKLLMPRVKGIRLFHSQLQPVELNDTEKAFFSEAVFLLKTFFFVYVGISIRLSNSWWMYAALILTVIVFVVRIPVVRLSIPRAFGAGDASLMAVIVPKGLVAAALASLPLQQGVEGGLLIQNIVFAFVLFSITLTSALVFLLHHTPLARVYLRMFSGFGAPASRGDDNVPTGSDK